MSSAFSPFMAFASICLLFMTRPPLRCNDVPPQHHCMVFMNGVVAVHWIFAHEIPEAHEEPYVLVAQPRDVLPAAFDGWRRIAVAREHLELFEVYVHGVLPAAGAVLQNPS